MSVKGTWKDENLPGAGQLFDLGTHLLDQIVSIFGRPGGVTGFVENIRGVGHPEVDDTVRIHLLILYSLLQLIILSFYF